MNRWRIAVVVEVEADTEDEATAAGDAICNEADTVLVFEATWVDEQDARLWARTLGPVRGRSPEAPEEPEGADGDVVTIERLLATTGLIDVVGSLRDAERKERDASQVRPTGD